MQRNRLAHKVLLIIILPLTSFLNRLLHFSLGTFVKSATMLVSCFSFCTQGVSATACQSLCTSTLNYMPAVHILIAIFQTLIKSMQSNSLCGMLRYHSEWGMIQQ
jgi:hypothetical protein